MVRESTPKKRLELRLEGETGIFLANEKEGRGLNVCENMQVYLVWLGNCSKLIIVYT